MGGNWARAQAGLGTVTGGTRHGLSTGMVISGTGHRHGRAGHGLSMGGLCPKVTGTH
jgi:hypothetical protein